MAALRDRADHTTDDSVRRACDDAPRSEEDGDSATLEPLIVAADVERVSTLLVARHDRVSRNTVDSERLWAALAPPRARLTISTKERRDA